MKKIVVLAVIALVCILAAPAYGQAVLKPDVLKANIPFGFVVEGKTLPAGDYEFKINEEDNVLVVTNAETRKVTRVALITALATDKTEKPRLTFDKILDKDYLEAVYPGEGDGFLIKITKPRHTHRIIEIGS